jgi:hypothetical protein
MIRCLASLRQVRQDAVPRVHRYYQDTMTSCRPSRVTSSPSFGDTTAALVLLLSRGRVPTAQAWSWCPVSPSGMFPWKRQDLPSSWATPVVRLHMLSDSGETAAPDRTTFTTSICFQSNRMAPARGTTKALAIIDFRSSITWLSDSLSTLRHASYRTQRKTRFRPSVKRYRTGFPPAGSQPEVSNSHHVNHPPPPSFLAQSPFRSPGDKQTGL